MKKDVIDLPLPRTNIQEVLYTVIENGSVSLFDFPYLAGFRTRVSELVNKYGLILTPKKHQRNNKFGNIYTYHIHSIKKTKEGKRDDEQYQKAIDIYKRISGVDTRT